MACELSVLINGITGDCINTSSGSFDISIIGSSPDYSILWINPPLGTIPLGTGITAYTQNSLSAGTYTFNVIDSCPSGNTFFPVNIYISSGTCVSILDHSDTNCGFNNGSITAITNNLYYSANFYLYETTYGLINSISIQSSNFTFTSLSAGTYYVIADDGGGCTGKTESCIIKPSSPLTFGLYQVNNSACAISLGSLHITGLTGTPPYTYLWTPNGETTSSITGLSDGTYTVTVTDGLGCETTQGAIIGSVPVLNTIMLTDVEPTCFSANGEATLYISGGTAPYHIQSSNGDIIITFATSYTFTGLSAGYFSAIVTDAGLCQSTATTVLLTPSAISVVSVNITNSNCNNNDGQISISLFGGLAPYTYTLIDSLGNSQNGIQPTQNAGFLFTNLASDTYIVQITDALGLCTYSQSFVVSNNVLYTLSATPINTTCNQPNGSVTLTISSGGTAPYRYQIDGYDILGVTGLTYSFTNLLAGNYTATVTDANLCRQILPFTVTNLSNLDFVISTINPLYGPTGEISVFITDGTPPFTINWSSNVNGQTGLTVTNLSADTYSVTITDAYGCVQTRTTTLSGYNLISSTETYTICQGPLLDLGVNLRKGPQQMLIEGFKDLTSGDTNCVLNQAVFEVEVTLSGVTTVTTAQTFYTATTLNDFPGDDDYYSAAKLLLLSFSGISQVIIEPIENTMTIATLCNPTQDYVDTDVIIKINIDYDISCVECEGPVTAPYIFEVDVNLAGSTGPGKFVLPLESGGTYDFNVDWGDGNFDTINTWNDPLAEHTYTSISNYTIKITGQLSGWTFNNGGDKEKMVEIKQWGILELGNSGGHFYGCNNLVLTGVTDFLNLTNCNTLFNTFRGCTSLTTINNIEYWDTSTITNMLATFRDTTSFDDNIENWNVENVTTINSMFRGCTLYNQPLNNWNTSSVTDTTRMFIFATSFNQDISNWDMGNNTQIGAMFQGATSFNQPLNSWNVSNVTSSNDMFNGATSFNQTLNNWNVINLISAPGMFNNATSFDQDLSTWNVSALQGGGFMFDGCNMSQTNYENLLIGWNSLPSLQPNVILGVNGLQYQIGSTADVARSNIIASYTWTFVGDIAVP